jgi:hypothetical protein
VLRRTAGTFWEGFSAGIGGVIVNEANKKRQARKDFQSSGISSAERRET